MSPLPLRLISGYRNITHSWVSGSSFHAHSLISWSSLFSIFFSSKPASTSPCHYSVLASPFYTPFLLQSLLHHHLLCVSCILLVVQIIRASLVSSPISFRDHIDLRVETRRSLCICFSQWRIKICSFVDVCSIQIWRKWLQLSFLSLSLPSSTYCCEVQYITWQDLGGCWHRSLLRSKPN